jgi:hypothetical protein
MYFFHHLMVFLCLVLIIHTFISFFDTITPVLSSFIEKLKKVKDAHLLVEFLKTSKNIFGCDLYGIHIFIEQYLDIPGIIELYLGIILNISCLLANFKVTKLESMFLDEKGYLSLTLNSFML